LGVLGRIGAGFWVGSGSVVMEGGSASYAVVSLTARLRLKTVRTAKARP
jgi:hypothetical protein